VPDECNVAGADCLDDGDDVVVERREGPVAAPGTRLAVVTEVHGDDAVPLGEDVDLPAPEGAVARPPMDEDHSGCIAVGAPVALVCDLDAVAAACHAGSMADAITPTRSSVQTRLSAPLAHDADTSGRRRARPRGC
jgi:hypothetical protein